MLRVGGGRLARLVVTLFIVTFAAFVLITLLPGDPARQILGTQYATPANVARLRHDLGFDRPILSRYGTWLGNAVHGDLGKSYRSGLPVTDSIRARLPVTIELVILAQAIALIGALIIAPMAATRRGSLFDKGASLVVSASVSIPDFTLAITFILLFAVKFHWLPSTGFVPLSESLFLNVRSMFLPALALAIGVMAIYVQVLRAELINVLGEDFVRLARARGLSPWYVMTRHVLRPASLPLLSLFGINTGALLGGAVLIETIFALPGIGRLTFDSITNKDYLLVQGVVVFITVAYVFVNFVVDLLYAVMDPRIRVRA